jgi:hypothetical protein
MKKNLGVIIAICVMALGGLYLTEKPKDIATPSAATTDTAPTLEQMAPGETAVLEKYREISNQFNLVRRDTPSQGWTREVFEGDERNSSQIEESLQKMETLLEQLNELPPSTRYPNLKHEIQLVMVHEASNLLIVSRRDQDLRGLEAFLEFASKMDTSPETFNVSPDQLRNEALVMAKKEVAILRPRLREGSGDAQGYLQHIIRAWRFTPSQLGLTKEDMKEVADK